MRGLVAVVGAACVAAAGCAGQQKTGEGAQPVSQQQRITNNTYFDLANCFPVSMDLPKPATQEALVGFLVAARPELNECLVDPKNRGSAQTTNAAIEVSVNDQGPTYKITGQNLTPEGTACIEQRLKTKGGIDPLAAGAPPVTGKIDFQHTVGQSPAVTLGVNEASDVVGTIRLNLPKWCDCFESWRSAPPKTLSATVELAKTSPTPTQVTFGAAPDETTGKVQACVTDKLKATQFAVKSDQLKLPIPFLLIHSGISDPLDTDKPELSLLQFDAIRAQSAASVAIALGARGNAAREWDAMVQKFNKDKKAFTLKQLQDGCNALLATDDQLLAAQEKQRDNEQRTAEFLKAQAAKDPAWAETVAAGQAQFEAAEKDIVTTKALRDTDAKGCPKTSYK